MFIVIYQAKGDMDVQRKHYGPFAHYETAEEFLASLPAAIDCDLKYIEELIPTPSMRGAYVRGATM